MANTSTENDIAALREDLASLRQDLSSLVSNLKADAAKGMSRTAGEMDENARDFYRSALGQGEDLYRSALNQGEQSARQLSKKIEDHPLLAIMLVLGAGYLGGRMLSR